MLVNLRQETYESVLKKINKNCLQIDIVPYTRWYENI